LNFLIFHKIIQLFNYSWNVSCQKVYKMFQRHIWPSIHRGQRTYTTHCSRKKEKIRCCQCILRSATHCIVFTFRSMQKSYNCYTWRNQKILTENQLIDFSFHVRQLRWKFVFLIIFVNVCGWIFSRKISSCQLSSWFMKFVVISVVFARCRTYRRYRLFYIFFLLTAETFGKQPESWRDSLTLSVSHAVKCYRDWIRYCWNNMYYTA